MDNESTLEANALPPWLAEPYDLCKLCVPGDLPSEHVSIEDALSRVAAAEVEAKHKAPQIAYSQCRGFAIRSTDTLGASPAQPTVLAVRSALRLPRVGIAGLPRLGSGAAEAILLPAGVPMPEGADAISPAPPQYIDDIEAPGDGWSLSLTAPIRAGNCVLPAGADCMEGDVLLAPGDRIDAAGQALCTAAGVSRLLVKRRPRIGVVVTSHDIVAPGSAASEIWQRPDSMGIYIRSLVRQWGYDVAPVVYVPPIGAKAASSSTPFSREAHVANVRELISRFDLIIACGMPADPLSSGEGCGDPIGFPFSRTRIDIRQTPASRLNFARSEDRSPPVVWQRTVMRPGALLPSTIRMESRDQAVLVNFPGDTSTIGILMHCIVRRIIELLEDAIDPRPHWEWAALEGVIAHDPNVNRMLWGVATSNHVSPARVRVVQQERDHIGSMRGSNVIVALAAYDRDLRAGEPVRILRL